MPVLQIGLQLQLQKQEESTVIVKSHTGSKRA